MERYIIESGGYSLDVSVPSGTDMDGEFNALCNDTGETLLIRGWMIEELEEI
jgi:hypothetical protein